jgi:hypothetical protein
VDWEASQMTPPVAIGISHIAGAWGIDKSDTGGPRPALKGDGFCLPFSG